MKAVTKAVIELGGEWPKTLERLKGSDYFVGNITKALHCRKDKTWWYTNPLCTLEELQAERERLYNIWSTSNESCALLRSFKDWLKTYKEDDDMWMPEVGEECEVIGKPGDDNYYKCKIVGHDVVDGFDCAVFKILNYAGEKNYYSVASAGKFRSIQSEEDRLVERCEKIIAKGVGDCEPDKYLAQQIVAANWRPIKPMTEDEFVNVGFVAFRTKNDAAMAYREGCRFLDWGE